MPYIPPPTGMLTTAAAWNTALPTSKPGNHVRAHAITTNAKGKNTQPNKVTCMALESGDGYGQLPYFFSMKNIVIY